MTEQPRVVVVGPDGTPITPGVPTPLTGGSDGSGGQGGDGSSPLSDMVSAPDKVMRIGTMIKQLLDEIRAAPLDDASRVRLRDVYASSIRELSDGLSEELSEELSRLTQPFSADATPSDAELRIAQAQLVGWLEGLFHGIQTALFAQQMTARAQLEEMRRRALPGGRPAEGGSGAGQYL